MGIHGPIPKPQNMRHGHSRGVAADPPPDKVPAGEEVASRPKASANWHPISRYWYNSLARSGQSYYYENSDWAAAYFVAEAMSRELQQAGPMGSAAMKAILSGMASLLTTEADRRRLRLELERSQAQAASVEESSVAKLDAYRARLAGGGQS